jgi:parvulin-like peptidyl-prolyl isomerase
MNVRRAGGAAPPSTPAGIDSTRRAILVALINLELQVQAAMRDTTIKVQDQEIQGEVEVAMKQIRDQYASDLEFQRHIRTSGFGTVEEYRRWLYDQRRKENLQSQLTARLRQKGIIKPVAPTEKEARDYYEATRPLQPKRPATVSFRQIVIGPQPDSIAVAAARARADSLVAQLRKGGDFNSLARRFSDDATTRETGGELNWIRLGSGMVQEFEQAAFALRPGQISDPVRTVFGFHIIQVQRTEPAEIQARHILIAPVLTDSNRTRAVTLADSVAKLIRKGSSWDSLSRVYHDRAEEDIAEGVPRTGLPEQYYNVLQDVKPGGVVGPFEVPSRTGPKQAILEFREARPEGEYTYDELRDNIRSRLSDENAMKRYIESLKKQTYVDIRY